PKTTAWNEFSSTMASAIICLATNQKFNFSKFIFEGMIRNLDNVSGKFLMYPSLVRAATTASSLEVEQDSGNITKTQSKATPNESSSLGTTSGGGLRRVKKLEQKKRSRTHGLKRLRKGRINAIDADDDIALLVLLPATTVTITTEEITLAQALEALKTLKPKVKEIVFQEPSKSTTIKSTPTISSQQSQNKSKGIMIEEHVKPMKKKVQIMLDEEVALKLRLRLIKNWIKDYKQRSKKSCLLKKRQKLFQQLLEQSRNHFAAKSAEEKRNKPPTQAQQRKIICTYLKNMEGKKPKDLKNKSFDSIQKMFDKAFKRVNTFVDFRTDLVEDSSKRAGEELEQESTKKQKVDEDKDATELQSLMKVIPDEKEVAIDVVPLATKPPTIVDCQLLKSVDKEDLVELYKLAKIEADHELAQRLQAKEQEELSVKEKAKLFQQLLEQRRKHFAAKNAEEKRNKPPTQAQQRKIMYLVEGSSREQEEICEQESTKKQKVDEDKDTTELQSLMKVIPDKEEVAIDVVPLATKPPTIIDWKIHKEGQNNYFQIIRADGSSKIPVEDMDLLLWGYLKTMFEPHVEDEIWKLQQRYKLLSWKLFDSYGVHCLSLQSGMIYMLVEKRYPLTPSTTTDMMNKKLQVNYFSKMAYQLLKLLTKQLKNQ
ncbi:hypothetical protein Tco_0345105, partial [Tanacetum coccineum]